MTHPVSRPLAGGRDPIVTTFAGATRDQHKHAAPSPTPLPNRGDHTVQEGRRVLRWPSTIAGGDHVARRAARTPDGQPTKAASPLVTAQSPKE